MLYDGFAEDREYLTQKFRNPVFEADTGLDNAAIAEHLLVMARELEALPRPLAKAQIFEYICDNMRIDVNPHDWFPGFGCYDRNARPMRGAIRFWEQLINSTDLAENEKIVQERNRSGFHEMWKDFDHSVPDWDAVLSLGIPGLRARAQEYRNKRTAMGKLDAEAAAFYDGIDMTVAAELRCIGRFIDFVESRHMDNPRMRAEAASLRQLRIGAPRDTYEALLLIFLHFMFCEHIDHMQVRSLGNLDRMLYPYYERDIREKRYSEEKIREFFTCFLMQWASINNYWGHPFYLGGTKADGTSEVNALSYLILDVFDELSIPSPKIQLKIAENTPVEFIDKALDMIRRGNNSLVFISEESVRRVMLSIGYSEEEARTCDIKGCYEFAPRAKSNVTGVGHINLLKPFELIFNSGMDFKTGLKPFCQVRTLDEISSFEEFYVEYTRVLDDIIDVVIKCASESEKYLRQINPAQLFSLTITSSLQRAKDAFADGSLYNNSSILVAGLASAVDALMATKELVFERHELTLSEFGAILKGNWKGAEKLRLRILNSRRRYGNGVFATDIYADKLARHIAGKINHKPNTRGGFFFASGHSARTFISLGEKTGATPDGRLEGEEMSKNISPAMGADRSGVTALALSVTTIDPLSFPDDFPLDVMLHPTTVSGADGLLAMRALLRVYMARHGISVHFNIFDAETLEDAQKHPEKYAGLQVRVCGWNVRFTELPLKEQNAYIKRARQIAE